ncbi:hypothetical protein ACP4J3_49695 [Streptomyces sp. UG1]
MVALPGWWLRLRLRGLAAVQLSDVVRAPECLAPLRTAPVGNISDAATGSLRLVGAGKSKVRLFLKRGEAWTYLTAGPRVTAAGLRAGLRLGLDGRDVVRDGWDGRIIIERWDVAGDGQ